MRVLLRSRRTKFYYAAPDQQEVEHERGIDFGNVRDAARFAFEAKLADAEIVLRYDSCDREIPLPVLAEWCLIEERAVRPAEVARGGAAAG